MLYILDSIVPCSFISSNNNFISLDNISILLASALISGDIYLLGYFLGITFKDLVVNVDSEGKTFVSAHQHRERKDNVVDAVVVPYDYHLIGINDQNTLLFVENEFKNAVK